LRLGFAERPLGNGGGHDEGVVSFSVREGTGTEASLQLDVSGGARHCTPNSYAWEKKLKEK